jgi:polysaccharide chain length determinant protein (PEP-CTERM system associated)
MQEHAFHPLDYLSLVRRRKWWAIGPLVVCVLGGIALAMFLPRVYRSYSTIAVSSPRVSTDLVGQGAETTRDERVRAISQQLLNRSVLEQVARAEGLDERGSLDRAVDQMLQPDRIRVEPTMLLKSVKSDRAPLDAFLLSYAAENPELAQRVTNRLANAFVSTTSRVRELRAEDTSAFIGTQLSQSKQRLDALEGRLREAKEAYMGRLPEQTDANLRMVASLQQQMESNANALRGEQDRLSMIERQIESLKQGGDDVITARGTGLSSAQARVATIQQQLAQARAIYTEKHPEIQRLQEDLANARREAAAEREQPEADRMASLQMNPTYRQLAADQQNSRLRINELQRVAASLRQQVSMYQGRVEAAPMVAQQLTSLEREYQLEKQQYTRLSEKLQAASLAESLERGRGGEQFKVLYAAFLPSAPESPNVVRLLLLSVFLGLVLGAGAAVAREYVDRSVHDVRTLQSEFDVPVLGEIGEIARGA